MKDMNESLLILCSLLTQETNGCLTLESWEKEGVCLHLVEGGILLAMP